ncbi:MAG: methylenetetrahydrofolate reductase [Candidatus Thorarchaeota archaeon]
MLTLTRLQRLLENGEFVVTSEVGPPHGSDSSLLTTKVNYLKNYSDAINITDNVRGIPTMDSMVCSHFVLQAGAEPVMQVSARDRNRILLQSSLYGAHALGVRNVLFITGDHPRHGTHPQAKVVFDFDSIQALGIARGLMDGADLAGQELEGAPQFYLGATFNPYADPMELQIWRVEKKRDSGAKFFQTQAIYSLSRFEEFMRGVRRLDVHVLAGIIPLKGPKMARFMNSRIPGIVVPEEIITRLERAGNGLTGNEKREAIRNEGLQIALETIEAVRKIDGVSGIHIMAVGWEDKVPEIVERAGLFPRPE